MDHENLLIPVYAFNSMEQAVKYRQESKGQAGRRGLIFYNAGLGKYYVQLPTIKGLPDVGLLENQRPVHGVRWFQLRRREDPKPEEAYLALLLMSGARRFEHTSTDMSVPPWVRRVSSGTRDCFVSWIRNDGQALYHTDLRSSDNQELVAHAVRSCRGIMYTRRPILGEYGHIEGFASRSVCVSACIMDKHPDKDDCLRVEVSVTDDEDWPVSNPSIKLSSLDQVWSKLTQMVLRGFAMECRSWPESAEATRRLVMSQQAKARTDSRLSPENSFFELVNQVGWQDALGLVEEPWHMEVVCRVYGERRKHYDINGARLPTEVISALIDKTGLAEDRRAELRALLQYPALIFSESQKPLVPKA